MKKTLFAAVLVTVVTFSGGLLLTTFPASAATNRAALACGKELQKLCGGMPVLANNLRECIQKSHGKISPRCVALANNVVRSCDRDALQHCQATAAGQSNILGCLRTAKRVVSPQCSAALDTAYVR